MNYCTDNRDLKNINTNANADSGNLAVVQLKNGSQVQTGAFAAMLHNIELYNAGERGRVEQELTAAVPILIKAGLFDLFTPEEWLHSDNAGRQYIGDAARKQLAQDKKFVFPRFFMI